MLRYAVSQILIKFITGVFEQSWMFGQKKEATDKQCCPVLAPFLPLKNI